MKSLEERHNERAQRKVDNAADGVANGQAVSDGAVANAVNLVNAANTAMRALSEDERKRVMASIDEALLRDPADDFGTPDLGGIGVVNTDFAPPALVEKLASNPASNGELPEATIDPAKGNANGQAVENAGGNGWGAPPSDEDGANKKKGKKAEGETNGDKAE